MRPFYAGPAIVVPLNHWFAAYVLGPLLVRCLVRVIVRLTRRFNTRFASGRLTDAKEEKVGLHLCKALLYLISSGLMVPFLVHLYSRRFNSDAPLDDVGKPRLIDIGEADAQLYLRYALSIPAVST